MGPVPVTSAVAEQKSVPLTITSIGTVEAINTVSVRAQVGGILRDVHFKEGAHVNQGDLLFTIDKKPYEAAVNQATAVMERDIAQAGLARELAAAGKELYDKEMVAKESYDQDRATAEAQEAVVRADRANLDNARLQLSYCEIQSPLTGVVGKRQVDPGNVVAPNNQVLVVINQLQPIYVSFSVPERELTEIDKYMNRGALEADASIPGQDEWIKGQVTFIDNAVDRATGTIMLRATFPNADEKLWPGQYVDVVLTLTSLPDAVLIPSKAIQTGQKGSFVFVIKDDQTVEVQPVTEGIVDNDKTVVEKGLSPGARVVTDGQLRLTPGAKVTIKSGLLDQGSNQGSNQGKNQGTGQGTGQVTPQGTVRP